MINAFLKPIKMITRLFQHRQEVYKEKNGDADPADGNAAAVSGGQAPATEGNKSEPELTDAQKRYNRVWEMWMNGELPEDIQALCSYEGGVNGEGHLGFFDNEQASIGAIAKALERVLPADFHAVFDKALKQYLADPDNCEDLEEADKYFYAHEDVIIGIMQAWADENLK